MEQMSVTLTDKVVELLADQETVKVLATTDRYGVPHAVVKQSLHADENGQLVYLELLESSQTNKNLVHSIWFNKTVAVLLKGKEGISYQIKGTPVRALVSGPVFQKNYVEIRKKLGDGDVDLAAVWIIEPQEVIDESYQARRQQEEELHPHFKHLDRIAR
jgi:hypothetical protein